MKSCTRGIKGITVSKVCYNLSVLAMKNLSGHSRQKTRLSVKCLGRNVVANLSVSVFLEAKAVYVRNKYNINFFFSLCIVFLFKKMHVPQTYRLKRSVGVTGFF